MRFAANGAERVCFQGTHVGSGQNSSRKSGPFL